MKSIFLSICLVVSYILQAQYFYNDIIGTQEAIRQMKAYTINNVKTVSALGTDKSGAKASDFSEFHEIRENGSALKVTSINQLTKTIQYSRFNEKGQLISLQDSSSGIQSITTYNYTANGKINTLQNKVTDPANDFNQTETHTYFYTATGKLDKMWRIITSTGNGGTNDSLEVRFVLDENGNPLEERNFRHGLETGYLYYYFDDKNRVTDIVRYNNILKKLLPDIMFEYDVKDRIIQKITPTSSINMGYLIWRYIFDEKGLKTKEALFNDEKQLTGKIEYSYTF